MSVGACASSADAGVASSVCARPFAAAAARGQTTTPLGLENATAAERGLATALCSFDGLT